MDKLAAYVGGDLSRLDSLISDVLQDEFPGVVAGFAYRVLALGTVSLIFSTYLDAAIAEVHAQHVAYASQRSVRNRAQRKARRVSRRAS